MSPLLGSELLGLLSAMGHGDQLAVVDANYPARSLHEKVTWLAGVGTLEAVEAITSLFPLDEFDRPCGYYMTPEDDPESLLQIHAEVRTLLNRVEGREVELHPAPRRQFYDFARDAFAAVQTSDLTPYACFLLTKGVVSAVTTQPGHVHQENNQHYDGDEGPGGSDRLRADNRTRG